MTHLSHSTLKLYRKFIIWNLINARRHLFIWQIIGHWKTFQTELSWLSTCVGICMKDLFIVVQWWCWTENGDYTGSKHNNVYKLNVMSQCSSVTAYIVVISLFYQEYSFTQLIQVLTFKNEPYIPFVRYKLVNYIVGVEISGKNNSKKCTLNKPQSYLHQGPF